MWNRTQLMQFGTASLELNFAHAGGHLYYISAVRSVICFSSLSSPYSLPDCMGSAVILYIFLLQPELSYKGSTRADHLLRVAERKKEKCQKRFLLSARFPKRSWTNGYEADRRVTLSSRLSAPLFFKCTCLMSSTWQRNQGGSVRRDGLFPGSFCLIGERNVRSDIRDDGAHGVCEFGSDDAGGKLPLFAIVVQSKGAEGCKELLEAFEACVKGATATS
ncbi:hypothetical protein DNTS_028611 [Danionella cerebrum]|uniref:Uncharacterized protein n=1 Tax=Danionella cerebrum TaxID=2873325 RepID=A0A553RA45_9TELE|nr:hypothetical protein DNTS_028611 [Danionella translucida]